MAAIGSGTIVLAGFGDAVAFFFFFFVSSGGGAALPRAVVVVDAPNPRRAVARRSLRGFITPNYSLWLGGEQAVWPTKQVKSWEIDVSA